MVKDHSDSERGNPLPPATYMITLSNNQQEIFYMKFTDRIVTPAMEHWLECKKSKC